MAENGIIKESQLQYIFSSTGQITKILCLSFVGMSILFDSHFTINLWEL